MINFKCYRSKNATSLPKVVRELLSKSQIEELIDNVEGLVSINPDSSINVKNGSIIYHDHDIKLVFADLELTNIDIQRCYLDMSKLNINRNLDYDCVEDTNVILTDNYYFRPNKNVILSSSLLIDTSLIPFIACVNAYSIELIDSMMPFEFFEKYINEDEMQEFYLDDNDKTKHYDIIGCKIGQCYIEQHENPFYNISVDKIAS